MEKRSLMNCGHPIECAEVGNDGESYCLWCDDLSHIAQTRSDLLELRDAVFAQLKADYEWRCNPLDAGRKSAWHASVSAVESLGREMMKKDRIT